jgi:hypothetical protein
VLLSAAVVPATAGTAPSETTMLLSVTSPEQYDTVWSALAPPRVEVVGRPGLERDPGRGGRKQCRCGVVRERHGVCLLRPCGEGNETIVVTLIDNRGKTLEAVLNIYVNVDISPPSWILVAGR